MSTTLSLRASFPRSGSWMAKIEVVMRRLVRVWSVFGNTTLECLANALEVNVILRTLQTLTHGSHVVLTVLVAGLFKLSVASADGSLFKLRDDAR